MYKKNLTSRHTIIKIVKNGVILSLLLISTLSATAQNKVVTMPQSSMTISEAIISLEKQTGYKFSWDRSFVIEKRVALPTSVTSFPDIMKIILKNSNKSYTLHNNNNILIKEIAVRQQPPATNQNTARVEPVVQQGAINGRISDMTTGNPVQGVKVALINEGYSRETSTDIAGVFSFPKLPIGQYDIAIYHSEFQREFRTSETVTNNVVSNMNIALRPEIKMSDYESITLLPSALKIDQPEIKINFTEYTPTPIIPIKNPKIGIKTNLLYGATLTPNLGVEFRLSDKWTLDIPVSYNPWLNKSNGNYDVMRVFLVQPEARYWIVESFNGHFLGANLMYSNFSVNKGPLDIYPKLKDYVYEGNLYGVGVSYGYQWMLSKRMAIEGTLGAGFFHAEYDKYNCVECGDKIGRETNNYFGVTKAGISLIFFIK